MTLPATISSVVATTSIDFSLIGTVLGASLVGSLHCAGMCGPFVAVYSASGDGDEGKLSIWRAHAAYHLMRGLGYVVLGIVGGAAGAAVDWAGDAGGVVRVAALVGGILVILWGLGALLPALKVRSPLERFYGRTLVKLGKKPRVARASIIGMLTPVLPCGWLYAFVITAAGTGSSVSGALVMFAFWIGTIPPLLGLGAVIARLGDALRAKVPIITSLMLIILGLYTIGARAMKPPPSPPADGASMGVPSAHGTHGSHGMHGSHEHSATEHHGLHEQGASEHGDPEHPVGEASSGEHAGH